MFTAASRSIVWFLSLTAIILSACNADSPTPAAASQFAGSFPRPVMDASDPGCPPDKTHPGGLIIEDVITPPAWGIAVRDDGLTYFTEPFHGGVGITTTQTRVVEGFIATGSQPTAVTFSPDGATAYVTNQSSGNVGVINVASAQQVATISIPQGSPFAVKVSPDGSTLFVSTGSPYVYLVDTQTREITKTVEVGFAPNAFAVHPDGRIMYVSAFVGGTVTEMDMFTGAVLRTFQLGGRPQDMAVTRNGKRLYVGNEDGYLNEIDLPSGNLAPNIPLAGGAFGIGVTPDDNEAYVAIPSQGLVQIFHLQSRNLKQNISVGGEPRRIAFSQRGHIGAISNLNGKVTFVR